MSGSQADISQCNRCRKQKPGDKYPFQSCRWDKCYSALANCVRALQRARYFPSFAFRFEPNVPLCCLYSKFPWTWEFPPLTALRSVHKLVRPKGSRIAPTIHFLTTNVTIHAVRVRGWCSAGSDLVQGSAFASVGAREPFYESTHSCPRSTVSR